VSLGVIFDLFTCEKHVEDILARNAALHDALQGMALPFDPAILDCRLKDLSVQRVFLNL